MVPESALVLGNRSLGLITLAMLEFGVESDRSFADRDFDRTYCLGRRERPDPTVDVIEEIGATYVNSNETPLETVPETHEAMDFVYEATGYAPHAFETVEALAPNGVGALLGIPTHGSSRSTAGGSTTNSSCTTRRWSGPSTPTSSTSRARSTR